MRIVYIKCRGGQETETGMLKEVARLPGVCGRTSRRYIARCEEDGTPGWVDRQTLVTSLPPADEVMRLVDHYRGWLMPAGGPSLPWNSGGAPAPTRQGDSLIMVASLCLFERYIHSGALTPLDGVGWTIPLVYVLLTTDVHQVVKRPVTAIIAAPVAMRQAPSRGLVSKQYTRT